MTDHEYSKFVEKINFENPESVTSLILLNFDLCLIHPLHRTNPFRIVFLLKTSIKATLPIVWLFIGMQFRNFVISGDRFIWIVPEPRRNNQQHESSHFNCCVGFNLFAGIVCRSDRSAKVSR